MSNSLNYLSNPHTLSKYVNLWGLSTSFWYILFLTYLHPASAVFCNTYVKRSCYSQPFKLIKIDGCGLFHLPLSQGSVLTQPTGGGVREGAGQVSHQGGLSAESPKAITGKRRQGRGTSSASSQGCLWRAWTVPGSRRRQTHSSDEWPMSTGSAGSEPMISTSSGQNVNNN